MSSCYPTLWWPALRLDCMQAEVIDEDNVVVTFSGQDEEDAEALAERILSPRLRGEP